MHGQPDRVHTRIGSRPGDPFADVIFGYMFARILTQVEQRLACIGHFGDHHWAHQSLASFLPMLLRRFPTPSWDRHGWTTCASQSQGAQRRL